MLLPPDSESGPSTAAYVAPEPHSAEGGRVWGAFPVLLEDEKELAGAWSCLAAASFVSMSQQKIGSGIFPGS